MCETGSGDRISPVSFAVLSRGIALADEVNPSRQLPLPGSCPNSRVQADSFGGDHQESKNRRGRKTARSTSPVS